jgi:hypothetical protein
MQSVGDVLETASAELVAELRVVYHASFGSVAEGANAARALREMRISGEGRTLRTRTLNQCAIAFLLNGDVIESRACITEALELARQLQISAHVRSAWIAALSIASALGDSAEVDRMLAAGMPVAPESRERHPEAVCARVRARRALELGDHALAARVLGSFDSIWGDAALPEDLFNTELRGHLRLSDGAWLPTEQDVDHLVQLHERFRGRQGHDVFVALLVEILVIKSRSRQARSLVNDYVAYHRREKHALHPRLREALDELAAGAISSPALVRFAGTQFTPG